jgi:N-acyl-L-homoserine lactone synthetase
MTVAGRVSGLDALDRLSQQLLAAADAGGIRTAVAHTPREQDAIHRLRHEQVVGHGWASPDDLPAGFERDEHDPFAIQVGAWTGAALAGTMRLVLPNAARRLPVEEAFGLYVEPRGRVVEAGRLVVAPSHRGDPAHRVWGALFARAWLSMRALGFSLLCGAASPTMVQRLRALGLPFEVLGAPRPYWGEPRVPVRLDPARGDPRWFESVDATRAPGSPRHRSQHPPSTSTRPVA